MNYLSNNIRFLRKQRRLSQQQFADDLGVKRSNIAAYETKNVEPRLSLIHDMATYFGVSLADLVISDLSEQNRGGGRNGVNAAELTGDYCRLATDDIDEVKKHSAKIQRMLDGFKVFYEFKQKMAMSSDTPIGAEGDIDNFLVFINHMLEYNRLVEEMLGSSFIKSKEKASADNLSVAQDA